MASKMSTRFFLRLALATLVSLAFLVWAFKDIDGHALMEAIAHLEVFGVVVYMMALCITQVARAARWGMLTMPFVKLSWREVWQVSNVGNMLIMLLPLRLGELGRPYLMRKMAGASMGAGMGAAVIERVLDGLLVTLLFFAVTAQQSHATIDEVLRAGAQLALAIFVSAVVVLICAVRARGPLFALVRNTLGRASPAVGERIITMLEAFLLGLKAIPDARTFFGVVGWTLSYWAANALGLWTLLLAFGLPLPPIAACTVVCVLVIGVMIPAGPGLLGTYQAAIMAGLSIYHVDKNVSAAVSVIAYLGNLLVIVAFGLPYIIGAKEFALKAYSEAATEP